MPKCSYCQGELEDLRKPCPKCGFLHSEHAEPQEIRLSQIHPVGGPGRGREVPAPTRPQGGGRREGGKSPVTPFRPLYRPPMLLICVLDDDGAGGEWIRVRGDSFVVGRTEGDYRVPHEAGMSARHLEFARQNERGEFFWIVRDLDTSNGTFARVEKARLRHGQELLLGSRRYRLDAGGQGATVARQEATAPPSPAAGPRATQPWHVIASAEAGAALVRLGPQGEAERYALEVDEQWIGTDGRLCRLAIQDDRYLDPRHARLYRSHRQWWIEDGGSFNGTWVAIKKIRIDTSAEIQVGEQRFKLKVP